MRAERRLLAGRVGQQLLGLLHGQLVGRQVVGDVGLLRRRGAVVAGTLEVGAVLAHAQGDPAVGAADREGRELLGVDVAELGDQLLEALDLAAAEVELGQLGVAVAPAAGDLVEHVLHAGGELVGHQPREVLLQQPDHRERQPGRDERGPLLVDVAAVEDGADDRGVRRGPADLALLELLDQRRLGVARRWLGLVALGADRRRADRVALAHVGQPGLLVVGGGPVVAALDVGLEEPVEGDHATAGGEHDVLAGAGRAAEADRHRVALRVLHLRGDGAHPDQLVEPELVAGQARLGRRTERVAGRSDRLVRLLGVLDLGGVDAGGVGDVLRAVEVACLAPRRGDRRLRERRGVGAHVGDEAVLVEPLRHRHRGGGAEAELAAGLLLQGRRAEGRVGTAGVGPRLDRAHLEVGVVQRARPGPRPGSWSGGRPWRWA